jgi:hypothetical protein
MWRGKRNSNAPTPPARVSSFAGMKKKGKERKKQKGDPFMQGGI